MIFLSEKLSESDEIYPESDLSEKINLQKKKEEQKSGKNLLVCVYYQTTKRGVFLLVQSEFFLKRSVCVFELTGKNNREINK